MKKHLLWFYILLVSWGKMCVVQAQTLRYGNEWIRFQQPYFKFPIAQNGIYRLDYKVLLEAGLPLDTLQARYLQVFHHGQEMALYKTTEGVLKEDDFLEFYAKKRDGTSDSLLYSPPSAMPHPYYSLFSDTTYYFLTVGNEIGKKIKQTPLNPNHARKPEPYHLATERFLYTDEFSFNTFTGPVPTYQLSSLDKGEGMTGVRRKGDTTYVQRFELSDFVPALDQKITVDFILNGRTFLARQLTVGITNELQQTAVDTFSLTGFEHQQKRVSLPILGVVQELSFTTRSTSSNKADAYSLSLLEITYPQKWIYNGQEKIFYTRPNPADTSWVIGEGDSQKIRAFYDITDETHPRQIPYQSYGSGWSALIPSTQLPRRLLMTDKILSVGALTPVKFEEIKAKNADYVMVYHPRLKQAASAYESYRKSREGGGYNTLLLNIHDLYNQFSFGEHSPLAIRRMADYVLQSSVVEPYLLLLGKAYSAFDVRSRLEQLDLIPTIGYPASDPLLTSGIDGAVAEVPAFLTGRIPATTNEQLNDYLQKLKHYEEAPFELWRKKILHLSGGSNSYEIGRLKTKLKTLQGIAEGAYVGAQVRALAKQQLEYIEAAPVVQDVNEGVGFMSFLGHSSVNTTDFNVGDISDKSRGYAENQRYPILFFNGCSYANVFRNASSQAMDWLFTPQKGAIAVVGQSHQNDLSAIEKYMEVFYKLQFQHPDFYAQSLGKILKQAAEHISKNNPTFVDRVNLQEMLILGDPAVRAFEIKKPDYQLQKVFVESNNPNQSLAVAVTWRVGVVVSNVGKHDPSLSQKYTLTIKGLGIYEFVLTPTANVDTLYLEIKNEKNSPKLECWIDSKNQIEELNEQNNVYVLSLNPEILQSESMYPPNSIGDGIRPLVDITLNDSPISDGATVIRGSVFHFRVYDNRPLFSSTDTAKVVVEIRQKCNQCVFQKQWLYLDFFSKNNHAQWSMPVTLLAGEYEMRLQAFDLEGNQAFVIPLILSFSILDAPSQTQVKTYPNPFENYVIFNITNPSTKKYDNAIIQIFSQEGRLLSEENKSLLYPSNIIYWEVPLNTPDLMYYRVLLQNKEKEEIFTGKLIRR